MGDQSPRPILHRAHQPQLVGPDQLCLTPSFLHALPRGYVQQPPPPISPSFLGHIAGKEDQLNMGLVAAAPRARPAPSWPPRHSPSRAPLPRPARCARRGHSAPWAYRPTARRMCRPSPSLGNCRRFLVLRYFRRCPAPASPRVTAALARALQHPSPAAAAAPLPAGPAASGSPLARSKAETAQLLFPASVTPHQGCQDRDLFYWQILCRSDLPQQTAPLR